MKAESDLEKFLSSERGKFLTEAAHGLINVNGEINKDLFSHTIKIAFLSGFNASSEWHEEKLRVLLERVESL